MEGFVAVAMPPDFPLADVIAMAEELARANFCVPGYIPPEVGLYDVRGQFFSQHVDQQATIVVPDRNIASRIAQLARGHSIEGNPQLHLSAVILAYCQCLDIQFEPAIAFHELASTQGQDAAVEEFACFRAADHGNVQETVALAMRRRTSLVPRIPPAVDLADLTRPLARWRRNYIIALKIVELERAVRQPLQRMLQLLRWMREDFIFGGPAAMFACIYFAPHSPPRRGSFKHKNSANRELALAGVRNAAWDLTQLSEFIRHANAAAEVAQTRFIFASFDQLLRRLAELLLTFGTDTESLADLPQALRAWWPDSDAQQIAQTLAEHIAHLGSPAWRAKTHKDPDFIAVLIRAGEARVRALANAGS